MFFFPMKLPGEFVPWVLSHDLHCRAFLWHNQDQDQWSQTPRIIAHQRNRLIHPVIGFIDSLKPGFHMIATIAEKKKVQRSYENHFHFHHRYDRWTFFSQRSYGNQALMYYDPGALGSLIPIRINLKERTHNIPVKEIYSLLPKNIFKRD